MIDKQTRNTYRNMAILPRGAVSSLVDAIDELEEMLRPVRGYTDEDGTPYCGHCNTGCIMGEHCEHCGRKLIW